MRTFLSFLSIAVIIAGCSSADAPVQPPEPVAPPTVATSGFLTAYADETIPMSVTQLRKFLKDQPLIGFLEPTENISNPVDTEVLAGTWGETGAVRRVKLADGHYVIERIVENDLSLFKYQLFVFTNSTARGVSQIVGEQRFVPVDAGTRFEWYYNVLPRNAFTRLFVRGRMDEIERYIANGLADFADAARAEAGD